MLNECLIHLFDYTCLNVMCVCSSLDGSNQKDFWSFYMYLEVIFITLCVHVICLPFFFFFFKLFKHVLCWKNKCQNFWLLVLVTCKPRDPITIFDDSFWWLASRETQSRVYTKWFRDSARNLPVANCPKTAF